MKNIHILPTDKPSMLWINNLLQGKLELSKEILPYNTSQNIYITSNENFNITNEGIHHIAGTWVLDTINNKPYKTSLDIISGDDIQKVILTTDQDLIKDGVQAIHDDFLEWFVKNSSCEEVGVELEIGSLRWSNSKNTYKIIFPKEEYKMNKIQKEIFEMEEELGVPSNLRHHNTKKSMLLIDEIGVWDFKKILYTEEEALLIWKAGQEYWKTSGDSITFEELTDNLKRNKI